ncbi:MAG: hypothetical protein HWD58_15755 [Bacteroidota bacterium]|nr:MAG: hypothetical protein HWD58_15755 [Bacteroidota bacterium]
MYGTDNRVNNNGTGLHYGTYNLMSGTGKSLNYGSYNRITNSGIPPIMEVLIRLKIPATEHITELTMN